MSGKALRLKRFGVRPNGRMVIFPLDHGISCGPTSGLRCMERNIRMGIGQGVNAFVLHKGMLRHLEGMDQPLPGIFMHLSASTQLGGAFHQKVLVGTVEEAIRRGTDGVSVHVNLGDVEEPAMLRDLGRVGDACSQWQMPLLVMIYVRGSFAPSPLPDEAIAHAARVAAELGADIIKIPCPETIQNLEAIVADTPVPVVVAGGSKALDTRHFLERLESICRAGVGGVAVGRNVFQHEHPEILLRAICDILHRGFTTQKVWEDFCLAVSSTGTLEADA